MGLFDSVVGALMGGTGQAGGVQGNLCSAALEMLHQSPGGLSGLVNQFESQGLGHVISSWIGPGANLPISAEQLRGVLGEDRIQELAAKVGLAPQDVTAQLANLLPTAIDKLTPNGQMPAGGLLQAAQSFLGGLGGIPGAR